MSSRLHAHAFKRTLRILGTVLAAIAVTFLAAWGIIRIFTIDNIVVDGQGITIEVDNSRFPRNLLFVPTTQLEKDLIRAYPLLSGVRFEKRFPHTLILHLVRRDAVVILESERGRYGLDAGGMVVDLDSKKDGLPRLVFDVEKPGLGTVIKDPRVVGSLTFLGALPTSVGISRMTAKDGGGLRAEYGNTSIFLPQSGDFAAKADTLQIIIEGFRIKGTLPTVIDLRYEKPIVTN